MRQTRQTQPDSQGTDTLAVTYTQRDKCQDKENTRGIRRAHDPNQVWVRESRLGEHLR